LSTLYVEDQHTVEHWFTAGPVVSAVRLHIFRTAEVLLQLYL